MAEAFTVLVDEELDDGEEENMPWPNRLFFLVNILQDYEDGRVERPRSEPLKLKRGFWHLKEEGNCINDAR